MVRIYDAEFANDGTEHWHLGKFWWDDGEKRGTWDRDAAHDFVERYPEHTYVSEAGYKVYVYPRTTTKGTKYIQTKADGTYKDNLTELARRRAAGYANV